MFTIKPVEITDAILTSSNVTEADATEWDGTGSLAEGTLRMVTTTSNGAATATHAIYSVASGGDSSVDPTIDDGTNWTFVSYTNRFKMFDSVVQSQTVFTGGIDVELTPNRYTNSIAFINVDAATIDIVMDSASEGEVYNESYSMTSYSGITDWYAYYFEPIVRITELVINDLPTYSDATLTININDDGDAAVGELVIGTMFDIGQSLHGANLGIIDYSVKSTSESGEITVTRGAYARRSQIDVLCETSRTAEINNYLASIRSVPVVWVADQNNAATIIYGYYREFNTILTDYYSSACNLQIEGLT